MRLKDKICTITGGGSGIGEAAAKLFAHEGAHVVVLEINEDGGRRVAEDVGGTFIKTDVSDPQSVQAAFAKIKDKFRRLDGLYNNASIFLGTQDGPVVDLDVEVYHKIISVNQNSVFYCSKYAIPIMIDSGGGAVVNTSSSAGEIGIPGCDAYTASKGATVTLTRSMAVEFAPHGVRVNCIAPAAIQTPMLRQSDLDNTNFDEDLFLRTIPIRRWGQPHDIARVALFLTSDESAFVNGAIVVADGGITIT